MGARTRRPRAGRTARSSRRVVHYLRPRPASASSSTSAPASRPPNVHEVAQEVAPATRVVYVDNDPLVLAHARALLQPPGRA